MALSTYLLKKTRGHGKTVVNGCHAMLHTIDPVVSTTEAERVAAGVALAETAMGVELPSDYFDQGEKLIGAAAGGYLPALGNNIVFMNHEEKETIA